MFSFEHDYVLPKVVELGGAGIQVAASNLLFVRQRPTMLRNQREIDASPPRFAESRIVQLGD
jgi:hypothetical protein